MRPIQINTVGFVGIRTATLAFPVDALKRRMLDMAMVATLVLAGCSPAPERSAMRPETARSAYFAANGITEVRYVRAAAHIADPKPVKVLSLTGDLPKSTAELLAKADVGSWKREYADDRVCDGMHWVVEFVRDGRVIRRIDGFNAEPDGLKYLLQACQVVDPGGCRRSDGF